VKPLELTIYPKLERPRTGAEIMPYREQWLAERELRLSKRLTTAELSAEYWYEATDIAPTILDRDPGEFDPIGLILYRFASLPHYDEDTA
jgi:hypothetical protein